MMYVFRIVLILILIIAFPCGLQSEVLGTAGFSTSFSGFCSYPDPSMMLKMRLSRVDPYWREFIDICSVSFHTYLYPTDIGIVMTATTETPGFSCAIRHLTNDTPEYVGVTFFLVFENSYGGPTPRALEQEAFSLDSLDFHGANITAISLRLDYLSFELGDGSFGCDNRLVVSCSATIIIEGTWENVATETTSWGYIKALFSN